MTETHVRELTDLLSLLFVDLPQHGVLSDETTHIAAVTTCRLRLHTQTHALAALSSSPSFTL